MNPRIRFGGRRAVGLVFTILASIFAWYNLVLMTEGIDEDYPGNCWVAPTKYQWIGLLFAVGIGLQMWLRQCFIIRPHTVQTEEINIGPAPSK